MKLIKKSLIFLLYGIRPYLGPAECKFTIGCTEYAVIQLNEQPLFKALWAIARRVLSCNPFNRRGVER
jgi:putative component of membrane protein insertase Oxa1/YidC/SpoIIIJ protein YidD